MVASPQTEDGYTKIANELFDALLAFDFSKRQMKVLLYVIRKTYGYNKKEVTMSYGKIAVATGMTRRNAIKTVGELVDMRGLVVEESGQIVHGGKVNRVRINKDYEQWLTSVKTDTSVKTTLVSKSEKTSVKTTLVTSVKTDTLLKKEEKKERNTTAGAAHRPCYSADFEQAWGQYPRRHGDNPKPRAFKAWNARLREGHTAEEIIAGIRRYAAFIRSEGNEGSRFVKQAATFLGPDKCFLGGYERQQAGARRISLAEAMGER